MAQVISDEQRALNRSLHNDNQSFGNRADASGLAGQLPRALQRMHELGLCNSVLDYGTGKGRLVKRLRQELPAEIKVMGYDPAVEAWEHKPSDPVDIVTCLDVLEHIEMSSIDAVLRDIHQLTKHFCYLVIDLQPAVKTLADGRNAHILLAPSEWWITRISQLFPCIACFPITHKSGAVQKLVIAATSRREVLPLMYVFLIKMKLFKTVLAGGPMGGV